MWLFQFGLLLEFFLGPVDLGVTTSSVCSGSSPGSDSDLDAEPELDSFCSSALGSRLVISETLSETISETTLKLYLISISQKIFVSLEHEELLWP